MSLKKNYQLKRNWKVMDTNENMFDNNVSILTGAQELPLKKKKPNINDEYVEHFNTVIPCHGENRRNLRSPNTNFIEQSSRSSLDVNNYQTAVEPRHRYRSDMSRQGASKFPYRSFGQRASSIPSSKESRKSHNDDIPIVFL